MVTLIVTLTRMKSAKPHPQTDSSEASEESKDQHVPQVDKHVSVQGSCIELKQEDQEKLAQSEAALKIQAVHRGNMARKEVDARRKGHDHDHAHEESVSVQMLPHSSTATIKDKAILMFMGEPQPSKGKKLSCALCCTPHSEQPKPAVKDCHGD
eukprot:gnl/MRDRNA2_/MRDRNA2_430879_c0_seq1.p1 gnl/MRDRNA2_/MRDRNA2_430879_c0~~gnl/MRDRNA2_/MRDRNA2_430879_c0_seq1.p1  ORF type:complete len:162 (+),score=23.10 gnl/MRDRNA2_/MRDRNA2_430879_c0_seq1:26-487(+)